MDNLNDIKNVFNELVDIDSGIKISNEDIFRIIEEKRKKDFLSSIIKKKNYELIASVIVMIGLLFYQEYRGFASVLTFALLEIGLFLCFIQSFIQSRILVRLQFPDTVISFKTTVDKYKKTVYIFRVVLYILVALIVFSILFNEMVYSLKIIIIACVGLIVGLCFIIKSIAQENKELRDLNEIVS